MGCVQSLFKRAQSSGLSPSSTEETGHKAPLELETHTEEEQKSSIIDEKPLEEPESNDTSYGVEATAVRTLAASTGTVAILGTTAKVKELNEPAVVDVRHSPTEQTINNEKVVTSTVFAESNNAKIADSPKKKEAHVAVSVNPLLKQNSPSSIEEKKKDEEGKNGIKEENKEKRREEIAHDNATKGEDGGIEEYNKGEVEERGVVKMEDEKINQCLASVPDEIEILATAETKNLDSTSVVIGMLKEPVRIIDFQEKKDRVNEPKIVEEMTVKKEENLNMVSHPGNISLKKEEDFEKIVSLNEQELKNEEKLIKIAISNEQLNKTILESEPASPETSRTEEDNDISSEQLKTNSLSDMSLSENLNSEGEETTRETAKALELKEMVASLSATANRITLDYKISEKLNIPKNVLSVDTKVEPSLQALEKPERAKAEPSKSSEESIEENDGKIFETPRLISGNSIEKGPSNVSITGTSEETICSKHLQEEKETSKLKEEGLENSTGYSKVIECKSHEKANDKRGEERQNVGENNDFVTKDKTMLEGTNQLYQEIQIQQNEIKAYQRVFDSKDIAGIAYRDEMYRFKPKELELKNDEKIALETRTLEQNIDEEQGENDRITQLRETPNENHHKPNDYKNDEQYLGTDSTAVEKFEVNDNPATSAGETVAHSGFQRYQVIKNLEKSRVDEDIKQKLGEEGELISEETKNLLNGATSTAPEMWEEIEQIIKQRKDVISRCGSKTSETEGEEVIHAPESLIKIAQAEVDKICIEAEKATESLIKENSEIEIHEEEFPAPPDELLNSESQNGEIKDDQSSSGTHSTEPTMPLGNNPAEGESSKTEDTTASSLAESEMPKSATQSPKNDDFRLESSVTENINTEMTMQRDSTEGELTMEEDSTREDDVLASTRSDIISKTAVEESLTPEEEEKAATVIQAGYRGFKTRKCLREKSYTSTSDKGTIDEGENITDESSSMKCQERNDAEPNSLKSLSHDKSKKELNYSAKKIQAGVRGYLVRRKQKVERDAAITIQSHFRGFKARQLLKLKSS